MKLASCRGALAHPPHPHSTPPPPPAPPPPPGGLFYWPFLRGGPSVCLTLCCFVVYSTGRFVLCLTLCYFVLVFFSPFSIAITSLGKKRPDLSAFRTFLRFAGVWFRLFLLPLSVWEGLRFVIVALAGLFSYLFLVYRFRKKCRKI